MEYILLIEDNLSDIALVQSYLLDAPFTHRLYKAKSLQEGLDIIRHNSISIVLLDLSIDDSAGFNTLRMFLQEVPNIPVIVLTGTSNEVLGMQIIRAGAQDYLVKGNFDGKQLIRAIRHSMKRFKAQVEIREELHTMQRREKRSQLLFSLVKLGGWELDLLDNSMQWSNELYQLLGYRSKIFEPKLSDYLRIVHPEEREQVKLFFQEAVRHSHATQIEHRVVINNRSVQYFCLTAQIVTEEQSDKVILIGSVQDVTEFKKNELNGLFLPKEKQTSQEIAGKLTSNLRHLTDQLFQLLKTFEGNGVVNEKKEQFIQIKDKGTSLLQAIYQQTNDLLLAGMDLSLQPHLLSFPAWKRQLVRLLESPIRLLETMPKIEWEPQLPDQIVTDGHLLSLLFFNFIQCNARLNDEKEPLHIVIGLVHRDSAGASLRLRIQHPELPLSIKRRKTCIDYLKSALQDSTGTWAKNGEAMPADLLSLLKTLQILQAELRTDKKQQLEVFIPVEIPEPIEQEQRLQKPLKMLIVEHQTIMQIALRRILKASMPNVALDFAEDVSKGVQKLTEKDYDLVLVDIQLPTTHPLEVVTAIKETKNVALMALASEFSKQDRKTLRSLGVSAFIVKPPQRDDLLQSLHSLL